MKTKILALIMIVSMIFVFTACSAKPELNFDIAKKSLEEADYEVEILDDKDELDIGEAEKLMAYSEDGDDFIYIIKYENTKYAKLVFEILQQKYEAEIKAIELQIKQIKCILEKFDIDLSSSEIDRYEDELKELYAELEEAKEEVNFGRKGKVVWLGTDKAIEKSKNLMLEAN
ncbi:MAG: hypothetical protein E7350_01640 [Clostridiales bacterium]|nr:hypothetical protein [Clostridiales bacterium]